MLLLTQVIEELRKLKGYIEKETGEPSNIVGVGLASRKHLCINPEVRKHCCWSRVEWSRVMWDDE